jgi:NodT family efflux transporter outer membrane factor (OMF) lipoprotein
MRQSFLLGVGLLCACTVVPDYVRPGVEAPAAYKEQGVAAQTWKLARPADELSRGKWWEIFNDPELNALEEAVNLSNQSLISAEAQFRQARALVRSARAGYFPTVTGGVSVVRSRQSATLGTRPVARGPLTDYTLPLDLSWEIDLWGRVRRSVEANEAGAQASAADLETLRLSLQAELASNYFELRGLDAERQLLEDTIAAYRKALQVTTNRYNAGIVSKADVAQAETQLKMTQAQAIDLGVQRAQLEHAIALLVNKPPSELSLPPAPLTATSPAVPVGVPSALLERRPDIAAAERRVAAANAQIGVAEAAYFPTITLPRRLAHLA